MTTVKELMKEIKDSNPRGGSFKDEVRFMKAMLNDPIFKVGIYTSKGKEGDYSPRESARALAAGIISGAASIPKKEAMTISADYQFTNTDAANIVRISKEFVNVYTDTGRKLPLGQREESHITLSKRDVKAHTRNYPKAVEKGGKTVYEISQVKVPAHTTMKALSKCPAHKKK